MIEDPLPQQNPAFVRRTFSAIAERYDLANHLLSGGIDFLWRARVGDLVAAERPNRVLDLATGSGDLAAALSKAWPEAQVVAADFCLPMLQVARRKRVPFLLQADGLRLPFQKETFDALTVAFGLRNMASWEMALCEMFRVLRSGGLVLVMDFSLPTFAPFLHVYRLYLHHVLPRIAGLLTGNTEAYEYLGQSIEKFPRGQEMISLIERCGFHGARQIPLCFGIASIYTAKKSA